MTKEQIAEIKSKLMFVMEEHGGTKIKGFSETIKEALEKQIPMKVKKIEKAGFGRMRKLFVCPVCDLESYDDPYCRGCGQALEWGD